MGLYRREDVITLFDVILWSLLVSPIFATLSCEPGGMRLDDHICLPANYTR